MRGIQHEVNLFGGFTGNFEGKVPSTDGGCVDNPFPWCDNLAKARHRTPRTCGEAMNAHEG
jgi:hypothetical protein